MHFSLYLYFSYKDFSLNIVACPGCMLEFHTLNANPGLVNQPISATSLPKGVDVGTQVDGAAIDIAIKFGQEITAIVVAKSPNDEPGIDRSEFEDIRQYLRDRRNIKRTTKSL